MNATGGDHIDSVRKRSITNARKAVCMFMGNTAHIKYSVSNVCDLSITGTWNWVVWSSTYYKTLHQCVCVFVKNTLCNTFTICYSYRWERNLSLLTLNVRGPSYLGLPRSISWLLLTSPGHQQPLYCLCRICGSLSYLRKDFKYLCHDVE